MAYRWRGFSSVLLRLWRGEGPVRGTAATGIVQQLSAGGKRGFADTGELLGRLMDWLRAPERKLGADHDEGNADRTEST